MDRIFTLLELILAVTGVIAVHRAHRRARAAFPEVVEDHPAVDGWRWVDPPTGLTIQQTPTASILVVPISSPQKLHIGVVFAGYATLVLSVVMLIQGLRIHENVWIPVLATPIFVLLGLAMVNLDARLERLLLTESHATLIVRYGLRLRRQIRLKRKPSLRIRGSTISVLEMSDDQEQPEYRLKVGLNAVLSDCNQTQGSWLLAGLKQWAGVT